MKIQDTDYAEQIESCASELRGSDHVLQIIVHVTVTVPQP